MAQGIDRRDSSVGQVCLSETSLRRPKDELRRAIPP